MSPDTLDCDRQISCSSAMPQALSYIILKDYFSNEDQFKKQSIVCTEFLSEFTDVLFSMLQFQQTQTGRFSVEGEGVLEPKVKRGSFFYA